MKPFLFFTPYDWSCPRLGVSLHYNHNYVADRSGTYSRAAVSLALVWVVIEFGVNIRRKGGAS